MPGAYGDCRRARHHSAAEPVVGQVIPPPCGIRMFVCLMSPVISSLQAWGIDSRSVIGRLCRVDAR